MGNAGTIDIRSVAFAKRLANLLKARREISGATIRELVVASGRAVSPRYLRAAEDGRAELDEQTVCELAALYGAELADILPARLQLRIEAPEPSGPSPSGRYAAVGTLSTSGITTEFDPHDRDSLLLSYLLLVRQLRGQQREPIIDLRRDDVEAIAEYLHEEGPSIVERLSTLMGATQLQRRAMVGLFIAGAIVIGLAGSGVAALTSSAGGPERPPTPAASFAAPTADASFSTAAAGSSADAAPADRSSKPSSNPSPEASSAELVVTAAGPNVADTSSPGAPAVSAALPSGSTTAPGVAVPAVVAVITPGVTNAVTPVVVAVPIPASATTPPTVAPGAGPVTTSRPAVATGEPPVPSPPGAGVADPPVPDPSPTFSIPDLPFDLPPPTAAGPTVATTEPPPSPPDSAPSAPATTEPGPTTTAVAIGEPPVP